MRGGNKRTKKKRHVGGGTKKLPPPPLARCQCTEDGICSNKPEPDSIFCKRHMNCRPPPLTGWEPNFNPNAINGTRSIRNTHNCFSYAMNVIDPLLIQKCNESKDCNVRFHQPGSKSGMRTLIDIKERRTCPEVEKLMKSDVDELTDSTFYGKCPAGTSKIALVVDPGVDYHFYRQNAKTGYYSHKPGSNEVTAKDALDKVIFNPETAARDYRYKDSELDYTDFCGFYCVPRNKPIKLKQGGDKQNDEPQLGGGRMMGSRKRSRNKRSRKQPRKTR
jgi:hypothetical protein